ncbi:MAG: AarF/UbiB family protein [Planctomycetota bacterium]
MAHRVRNVKRLAEILRVLVRHGFGEIVARLNLFHAVPASIAAGLNLLRRSTKTPASRGERLRAVLVELGPTYIKLGQVLSTRPDLIPPDVCADLEELQDRVPSVSDSEAAKVVSEELGAPPGRVFGSFGEKPIASASISQVYRATLKDGTAVAVKVQRPGIAALVTADIELLESVAAWIVRHGVSTPGFDPLGSVNEFSRSIRRELDFVHEARMVERFARNFASSETVHVPKIYSDLSTSRVLTMEWIAGTPVRDVEKLRKQGHDLCRVAHNGLDVVLKQIFEHGLFHADPHPGNIFVLPGDVICLLDYGMVGQVMPDDGERFATLLHAIFGKDVEQATSAVLDLAEADAGKDRKALQRDLHEFIEFDAEQIMKGMAFGEAMNRLVRTLREHELVLPAKHTLLIKALATIEQVGRDLDPNLDLAKLVRPYIVQLLKRRYSARRVLSDVSRAMRDMIVLARLLPGDARELVASFKSSGFKISLRQEDIHRVTESYERSASRMTFGMIIGSLIVGSSLLMQLSRGPNFLGLPVLGLVGYLLAAILGLGMVYSMWRSRKL